jgi:predicted phage replisome organizer
MADVKWIKLYTDMFDNRKIKVIKQMPEGKAILLIWIQLIILAGQINDNGAIYFTKEIAYTDEMLAKTFDEKLDVVRGALAIFAKYEMIDLVDNIIYLNNWEKYQNSDALLTIRENTRKRVEKYRQKQLENRCNVTVTLPDTLRNAIEIEKEEDKELEKEKKDIKNTSLSVHTDLQPLKDYWNSHSLLAEITSITDKRKIALNARIKEHGIEAIYKAIDNVGKSKFMRGGNDKNWYASFDWVFAPNNFVKVLEGNYLDKEKDVEDMTARAEKVRRELGL